MERQTNGMRSGYVMSIRVPAKLIDRFDRLAQKARRTRAEYLRMAIEETVARGGLPSEVQK